MKFLTVLLAALGLCSCNTMIGMGRDTKMGFNWTKNKIQQSRQGSYQQQGYQQQGYQQQGNQQDSYGAPVY